MNNTEQNAIKFIDYHKLIAPGDRVLAALSGGPDSVFLLTFLIKFKRKYKIDIAAFHLNHMLRKKAADKDEEFCRKFCSAKKIPLFCFKKDIEALAVKEKISVEEAGRNLRYELLNRTAEENNFTKIATGHNIQDNSETVLLNIIKGAGLRGISGIPVKRGKIIRPLLGLSKTDIKNYLDKKKIGYITDRTNLKDDYERNFIRNRIVPLIKKRLNPSVDDAILRSSMIFRDLYNYIERKASEAVYYVLENNDPARININKLAELDEEIRPEVIRKIMEGNFVTGLSFKDTMLVLDLLNKGTGAKIQLPAKVQVLRERTYLSVIGKQNPSDYEFSIKTGSNLIIDGKELSITELNEKPQFTGNKNIEFIDGDKLGNEFIVRNWRSGDKFTPLGLRGTVKISDFLNSMKIPVSDKKKQPVLTGNGEIVWVIGYRISEKFKIKEETNRILKLCLR